MEITENKKTGLNLVPIVWLGFLTGTLDAIAAILFSSGTAPAIIFKYIASGAFGKAAFAGGTGMVLWGIFFHYLIAYSFTAIFYLTYPAFISALRNKYITAVVFAAITWIITNLIVIPVSQIGWHAKHVDSILIGFAILIFTIGLPIALFTDRLYRKG
jgi:hypothetical protein